MMTLIKYLVCVVSNNVQIVTLRIYLFVGGIYNGMLNRQLDNAKGRPHNPRVTPEWKRMRDMLHLIFTMGTFTTLLDCCRLTPTLEPSRIPHNFIPTERAIPVKPTDYGVHRINKLCSKNLLRYFFEKIDCRKLFGFIFLFAFVCVWLNFDFRTRSFVCVYHEFRFLKLLPSESFRDN